MAETRTELQIEANLLDMQVFRLVTHIERFAASLPSKERPELEQMARNITAHRSFVRHYMHRRDREETQ